MKPSLYKPSQFFMVIAGLWRVPLTNKPILQQIYSIYSITIQSIFVINIFSMLYRIWQLFKTATLEDLYINITLAILVIEITYKVLIYVKNRIPYMFFSLIAREEKILNSNDKETKNIYLKRISYYKLAIFCQCFWVGIGIVYFISTNVYNKYVLKTGEHFMYEIWFPFNEEKHDLIVTSYNILIALYGFCFSSASSTPLQTLMIYSVSQLQILQVKLRNSLTSNEESQEIKIEKIKQLIREHQLLIEFLTTLNKGVKEILLLDYAMESVNGAGGLLQLVSVKKAIEIPYCMIFIFNVVITMCFTAWSANEVKEQSANIANAIYESNWMDQSEPLKKMLLIMIMRAQKPITIDIGPFMAMDAAATLSAFKGMYSYATFMKQVRSKDT